MIIIKRVSLILLIGVSMIGLGSGCSSLYEITHMDGSKEYVRAWNVIPEGTYAHIYTKGAPDRFVKAYAVRQVQNLPKVKELK